MKRLFYELQSYYLRDVYFICGEKSNISYLDISKKGRKVTGPVHYDVDILDQDVNKYGILPTIGPALIHNDIKTGVASLCHNLVTFYDALITDANGVENNNFSMMVVDNKISCLDIIHSDTYLKKYSNGASLLRIKKLVLDESKIDASDVFCLQEKTSYIIVSDAFITRTSNFKGFNFLPVSTVKSI